MKSEKKSILLLSAMQQEYDAVISNMTDQIHCEEFGISIVEGYLFGRRCIVAISGVGKVASAFTAQYLLGSYQPEFVVFTGVAGALNSKYQIGDIVIARDTIQHDIDGRGLGFPRGEVPYSGLRFFDSDRQLLEIAEKTQCAHDVHIGRILTGDQFIINKGQAAFCSTPQKHRQWLSSIFESLKPLNNENHSSKIHSQVQGSSSHRSHQRAREHDGLGQAF